MKRFFTLLFLSALFTQSQAQVLFFQDFESGSVAPMTALDLDGKVLDQNVGNLSPTWDVFPTSSKNRSAISTSWFSPVGMCDDWLISPPIDITDANTFLIWEASSYGGPPYQEAYEVRVSTTGDADVANFTDILFSTPAELNATQRRVVNFDAYIGQTIHFAFRNNSFDKFLMFLDNIEVKVLQVADITLKSVSFEKYNPVNTEVPVVITLENNSAFPLNTFYFTWTVGDESFTDTITGFDLGVAQTASYTHSVPPDLSKKGEFPVNVTVTRPNEFDDYLPADNEGQRLLYGLDEQLPKKVIVEEGTGTWCGFCSRGFVVMDQIHEDYADVAIPIAVHNGDPMVVPDYDDGISASLPGYPSGNIDRKEIGVDPIHPSTGYGFINAINNLDDRMVPVEMYVETALDESTRTVEIKAIARISIPTQLNNLRFSCVITEDGVTGTGAGYDQVNYYGNPAFNLGPMGGYENLPAIIPASQMVYDFVARALIGGYNGMEASISDALEAGEFFEYTFTYQVPAGYNMTKMKAIVFILDDETGEILNGDDAPVTGTLSIPLIPAGKVSLFPNPAVDFVNLSVDFQTEEAVNMKIYTTYGTLVKDLGIVNLTGGKAFEKINIADFSTGMYILELRQKNAVTALPFTKI